MSESYMVHVGRHIAYGSVVPNPKAGCMSCDRVELDRLRAENERLTENLETELYRLRAGRDRVLAACKEADLGERWNLFTVAEVRQLLVDTPAPTEGGAK